VYASHSGTVTFAGRDGDWGNTIVIRGDDGLVTRYSHNTENYVRAGERVEAGQHIAMVGNTGRVRGVTGLHLDFRVYKNGVALNPLSYLK
jgi:murein DD-endopeptidase MepM/ murein hydrolase activator NlpD